MARSREARLDGPLLLDATLLIRLYKCDALAMLRDLSARLIVADQVHVEITRDRAQATAVERALALAVEPVRVGSAAYDAYCGLVGDRLGTTDLGELESIALAVAHRERGVIVPFATLDRDAARIARDNAVITLDFRDVLSFAALNEREWPPETIADLEARAAKLNGWRPPTDESSSVVEFGPPRRTRAQASLRAAAELASPPRGGRRRR